MQNSKHQKIIPLSDQIDELEDLQTLQSMTVGLVDFRNSVKYLSKWEAFIVLSPLLIEWLSKNKCQPRILRILLTCLEEVQYPLDMEDFAHDFLADKVTDLLLKLNLDDLTLIDESFRKRCLACCIEESDFTGDPCWYISVRQLYMLTKERDRSTFFHGLIPSRYWNDLDIGFEDILEILKPDDNMAFLYCILLRKPTAIPALRKYWSFVLQRTDAFDIDQARKHLHGIHKPEDGILRHLISANEEYASRSQRIFSATPRNIKERERNQWLACYFFTGLACNVCVIDTLLLHVGAQTLTFYQRSIFNTPMREFIAKTFDKSSAFYETSKHLFP